MTETNTTTEIPTWLTAKIFDNILQDSIVDYDSIKNFEIKPALATGENFMTVLLNIKIDVQLKDGEVQQHSYMVKILPNSEPLRENLKIWKVFDKEHLAYTSYLQEFEEMYKAAGKVVQFGAKFYASKHVEAPKELIILEDLRVRGFQNIKRQEGLDVMHTERVLEKLAQFHAASACRFEQKGAYPKIFEKSLCSEEDLFEVYRNETVKILEASLPLYDAVHLKDKLIKYASSTPDPFQAESNWVSNDFNVLNHGDCWSNNFMFKYNADGTINETYLVDFQMSRYGSPSHDLIYLLISSTNLEIKIKKFDYFVAFYHKNLVKNLKLLKYPKKLPTLKNLHIELLRNSDWVYTSTTTVMPVMLLDPTEQASMESVIDDGEKGNELKKLMFTSKRYMEHMKKILPWMDNRGCLDNGA